MDRARGAQREAGVVRGVRLSENLNEVQHRAEMARLERQRALQVVQALFVPPKEVVQNGALVPGFGEVGNASQQQRETGLRDIEAPRRDVAGGEVKDASSGAMRVVHPHIPDALFRGVRFSPRATGQAAKQLVEEGRPVDRPPRAIAADQPEDFNQWPILVEIPRRGCERAEQRAVVQKAPGDQVHDLAVALDHALHAKQLRAEQLAALAVH